MDSMIAQKNLILRYNMNEYQLSKTYKKYKRKYRMSLLYKSKYGGAEHRRLRIIPNESIEWAMGTGVNPPSICDVLYPWPGGYDDEPPEYSTEAYLEDRYNFIENMVESDQGALSQIAPAQSKEGLNWAISGEIPLMIAVQMFDENYSRRLIDLFLQHGAGGNNLLVEDSKYRDTVLHKVVDSVRVNKILDVIKTDAGFNNTLFNKRNKLGETAYDSAKYFQSIYGISEANLEAIRPS